MRSVRQTVERRFESYSGSCFFGDESRVCCGCGAGSPSRPSLFPSLHLFYYGVMHVIIVACPHPLSCCIYVALIPCLAAYMLPSSPVLLHIYCTCFSTFWHCHPYILQHFNGNIFTPFIYIYVTHTVHTVMAYVLLIF